MPDSDHRSPLSLEDLLQLKRAERPPPEFWSRFESELRQKQLAALIDRRPWWQTAPRMLAGRRVILPLGAAAVLAFSLISVKLHSPKSIEQIAPTNSEPSTAPAQIAAAAVASPIVSKQLQAVAADNSSSKSGLPVGPVQVADAPLSANLPDHASELTPWSASQPVQSPAAKLFATNIETPARTEIHLVKTLVDNSFSATANRLQRSAEAELASVSALASKRSRLLAQFNERQFTPEPQASAIVRERLTRQLLADATSVSDHFTRVGLKGDQVSLKF